VERVASDAECLLRLAEDGTVSADNLKGLRVVSRVIELERTTDSSRDVGRALPSQGHFFDNLSIVLDQRTTPLSRFLKKKKAVLSQPQNSIQLIHGLRFSTSARMCETFRTLGKNTMSYCNNAPPPQERGSIPEDEERSVVSAARRFFLGSLRSGGGVDAQQRNEKKVTRGIVVPAS
jgi:hypothetical protein